MWRPTLPSIDRRRLRWLALAAVVLLICSGVAPTWAAAPVAASGGSVAPSARGGAEEVVVPPDDVDAGSSAGSGSAVGQGSDAGQGSAAGSGSGPVTGSGEDSGSGMPVDSGSGSGWASGVASEAVSAGGGMASETAAAAAPVETTETRDFARDLAALVDSASDQPGADFPHLALTAWGLGGAPWEETSLYEEEKQRALGDAMHHAWESMTEVPLMANLTIGDAVRMNPALTPRLRRILLAAPRAFYSDDAVGLVRCRLRVPMSGAMSLRSALYLAALTPDRPDPAQLSPTPASAAAELLRPPTKPSYFKRVVLDARHLQFLPSLFPRFYGEDGKMLFQEGAVFHRARFTHPAVRYITDVRQASSGVPTDRVLFIRARPVLTSAMDLVIPHSELDAFVSVVRHLAVNPLDPREVVIILPATVTPGTGIMHKFTEKTGAAAAGAKGKKGDRARARRAGSTEATSQTGAATPVR